MTLEEAEQCAHSIIMGERFNILFEYSYLKDHFYEILQKCIDVTVINCDSKQDRFMSEVEDSNGLLIFDHINKCSDKNILNNIKDKILVC